MVTAAASSPRHRGVDGFRRRWRRYTLRFSFLLATHPLWGRLGERVG
jgi:hypothetical protein